MTASRATLRAKNEGTACSDQEVKSGEDKGKYYSVRLFVCVICLIQLYNVLNKLSSVVFLQYPINIPSSSVNLHLTLLPVMNFRWFSAI